MPKTDLTLESGDYVPVAVRISLFYARHPTGRIVTRLESKSEREVMFRALVFRGSDDAKPAATGWASERLGDGEVNAVACLENTETSAIGRALANLGITASTRRPSAEEMAKAMRARDRLAVAESSSTPAYDRTGRSPITPAAGGGDTGAQLDLHPRAEALKDALDLLARATAIGLSAGRARILRAALVDRATSVEDVTRIERHLRRWIARPRRQRPRAG